MTSAVNLVEGLTDEDNFILDTRQCFVYSHQTNIDDLVESQRYLSLEWIEFLEFVCRVAVSYGQKQIKVNRFAPFDVDEQVHAFLELLWARRRKEREPKWVRADGAPISGMVVTKPLGGKPDGKIYAPLKKKDIKEFPELCELADDDSDGD